MFFSFDGIDGVGKSTQVELFCRWLREEGHDVVACRDPGTTALGEEIRRILLDPANTSIARRSEMLLYMAARAQLVDEVIAPALASGKVVVSDRFLLANVVYQGHAGGLDVEQLWQVGEVATGGVEPDLTILLDIDIEAAADRLNRPADRMEASSDDFRRRLRQGFLAEAARRPDKIKVIDAADSVEAIHERVRSAAEAVLNRHREGSS